MFPGKKEVQWRPLTGFILMQGIESQNLDTGVVRESTAISERDNKTCANQILFIFKVLFPPISQTWPFIQYFKASIVGYNYAELRRPFQAPEMLCLSAFACWTHCECGNLPIFLLHFVKQWIIRKRPATELPEAFLGWFSPEVIMYQAAEKSGGRTPAVLSFALCMFSDHLPSIQKMNICTTYISFSSILI